MLNSSSPSAIPLNTTNISLTSKASSSNYFRFFSSAKNISSTAVSNFSRASSHPSWICHSGILSCAMTSNNPKVSCAAFWVGMRAIL